MLTEMNGNQLTRKGRMKSLRFANISLLLRFNSDIPSRTMLILSYHNYLAIYAYQQFI